MNSDIKDSLNNYINFQKSLLGFETKRKYGFKKRKFKKYLKNTDPLYYVFHFSLINNLILKIWENNKE